MFIVDDNRIADRGRYGFVLAVAMLAGFVQAGEMPDPKGDWEQLTPQVIRDAAPTRFQGDNVELLPLQWIYSFPTTTFMELEDRRRELGTQRPLEAIVVADGSYDLAMLADQLNDPEVLERTGPNTYTVRRPIYVTPTADLVIRDATLRLSIPDMSIVVYHGDLVVIDSRITTWDESRGDYGPREIVDEKQLLTLGTQRLRPYLLGLRGSRSYFAASHFHGLGYHGHSGTFGISLAAYGQPPEGRTDSLAHVVTELSRPVGVLVGNTITRAFYGFFTNLAGPTALVGNVFRDNVVYGIDPHDYSLNTVVARNLVVGTRYKHGIILSREVDGGRISQNISAGNGGTGIMLDRGSDNAVIDDNIVFANSGDGIAVFESDGSRIEQNLVFANYNDGIHLRNSSRILVESNTIDRNGHYGIEARAASLAAHVLRDTLLDPYAEHSEVSILDNALHRNLTAAIAVKGRAEVFIRGNDFSDSTPQIFAGDLEIRADAALRANRAEGYLHAPDMNSEELP